MSKRFTYKDDPEQLFQEAFRDYRVTPDPGVWKSLSRRIQLRRFLRFEPARFNVYYASLLVAAGITASLLLQSPASPEAVKIPPTPVTDSLQSTATATTENTPAADNTAEKGSIAAEKEKSTSHKAEVPVVKTVKPGDEKDEPLRVEANAEMEPEPRELLTDLQPEDEPELKKASKLKVRNAPRARFNASQTSGCAPLQVSFENLSLFADSVIWQFGDGGSSRQNNPSYVFDEAGEYVVHMRVFNAEGESSLNSVVKVFPKPEARFEIEPEGVIIPDQSVRFLNYSREAVRYHWDFGDGQESTAFEPEHKYSTWDNYTVKLSVWSDRGCRDTVIVRDAFGSSNCHVSFPNAFMPNMNGPKGGQYTEGYDDNEIFHPVCRGVVEYQLSIFTRRGVLIFESHDVRTGWDGYLNGQLVEAGVYIWKVRGTYINGQPFVNSGDVTVVYR